MKVSVLLLTFNEEANLPRCLDALSWCDDIVIIDSGSTDRTLEIAQHATVRIRHRAFDNFAEQRNFGLEGGDLRHDWVLHLDADEVVTEAFRSKLAALSPTDTLDGYRVPSKMMLGDYWLKYAGMYPTYQVRLGHRDRLRFVQVGHGQREAAPPERIGSFDEPYLHFNFSHGLKSWLSKHLNYADAEARLIAGQKITVRATAGQIFTRDAVQRRRSIKSLANRLPLILRPIARFVYVLVWRRGFLDGRYGLLYALMLATYEAMIAVLAAEIVLNECSFNEKAGIAELRKCSTDKT